MAAVEDCILQRASSKSIKVVTKCWGLRGGGDSDTTQQRGLPRASSTWGSCARSYRREGSGAIVWWSGGVTEKPLLKHCLRVFHWRMFPSQGIFCLFLFPFGRNSSLIELSLFNSSAPLLKCSLLPLLKCRALVLGEEGSSERGLRLTLNTSSTTERKSLRPTLETLCKSSRSSMRTSISDSFTWFLQCPSLPLNTIHII